ESTPIPMEDKNAGHSSSRYRKTAMLSRMVSVSAGSIHSRYAPAAAKSEMVMLSLKGFLNVPPSPPLVTPRKVQPNPGDVRIAGASWPFFYRFEGRPNMKELIF